jgi:ribose 5-phosphate isomerase A
MPTELDMEKVAAAAAAAARVEPGMYVALGTGSTAALAIHALGVRFAKDQGIRTVASSPASEALAQEAGLPVGPLQQGDRFDLMVDGADEVTPALELTKGGGGALFREKLLARLSREVVIAVDHTKVVDRIGERSPLPLETVPFARPLLLHRLAADGYEPELRMREGRPWITDNGNELIDLHLHDPIEDLPGFEAMLRSLPGVIETGLFLGIAHRVFIGRPDGTVEEWPAPSRA